MVEPHLESHSEGTGAVVRRAVTLMKWEWNNDTVGFTSPQLLVHHGDSELTP